MYYKDPKTGEEVKAERNEETGEVIIPKLVPPVTEVYTKTEPIVTIDISEVVLSVNKASISSDGTKVALNVEATKTIASVKFGEENIRAINATTIDNVFENIPEGTTYVTIVYSDNKTTKVELTQDEAYPETSNIVTLPNGHVLVTLEDEAGISKIIYYKADGTEEVIEIPGAPTKVTQELDLPEGVDRIIVVDAFGEITAIDIGEGEATTQLEKKYDKLGLTFLFSLTLNKKFDMLKQYTYSAIQNGDKYGTEFSRSNT